MLDLLALALASGLVLLTAARTAVRMYPTRPWSRVLACGVLTVGEIVAISQLLGALALYRSMPVLLVTLGGAVATSLVLRATEDKATPPAERVRWPLTLPMTLALATFALGTLAVTLGRPSLGLDTLQYHWPLAAHWVEVGDLTTPKNVAIGNYAWYYPSNLDLVGSWTVLLSGRDLFLPWVGWIWFGFALAAVAGVVRRFGGRLATAALAGLAVCTLPVVLESQLRSGQVDLASAGLLAAAAFFFVAWYQDGHRLIDAALGGVALGLSAGSKLVSLPYAALIGLMFAIAVLWSWRRKALDAQRALASLAYAAGLTALSGGFFYFRNLVQTGNPLFPSPLPGLEGAWFPFDIDRLEFSVSDYLIRLYFHPWIVGPWLLVMWVGGLVALGALVAVPFLLRRDPLIRVDPNPPAGGGIPSAATRLIGCWVLPLLAAGVYVVTPTTASGPWGFPGLFTPNLRYALPFVMFAIAGLAAAADPHLPRFTPAFLWGVILIDLGHLALLFVGVMPLSGGELPAQTAIGGLVLGAFAAGAAWAVYWGSRKFVFSRVPETSQSRFMRSAAAGAVAVALLAGVGAAWFYAYTDRFDFITDDYGVVFDFFRDQERVSPEGVRIAYSAFVRNYPLYGSHLQNEVVLAAAHAPGKGDVARPFDGPGELLTFMCEEEPDFFVATEDSPIDNYEDLDIPDDDLEIIKRETNYEALRPREVEWAAVHPDVFRVVAHKGDAWVFRVDAAAACAARESA